MAKITIEELSGSLKEYLNGLGLTEAQVQELIDKFEDEKIGDISQLSTEEKESLVGAINEVNQKANKEVDLSNYQQKTDNSLQTSSKNLVGAINEVNQKANKEVDLSNYQQKTDNSLQTSSKNLVGAINEVVNKTNKNSLTSTIGDYYTTPANVNSIVDGKDYQTSSEVQQTVDELQAKVIKSGGYNLIYNGSFENGTSHWRINKKPTLDSDQTGINLDDGKSLLVNYTEKGSGIYQYFPTEIGETYGWSCYIFNEGQMYVGIEGCNTKEPAQGGWQYLTGSFTATEEYHVFLAYSSLTNTSGNFYIDNICVCKGLPRQYSPNPNEIYDGETTVDKNGIKVTSSNINTTTEIDSDSFRVVDNASGGTVAEFSKTANIPNLTSGTINAQIVYANNLPGKENYSNTHFIYVNGSTGSDTNNGTSNSPYKTVQRALNDVSDIQNTDVTIYVYNSVPGFTVRGFTGAGVITLNLQDSAIINTGIWLHGVNCRVNITNESGSRKATLKAGLAIDDCRCVNLNGLTFRGVNGAGNNINVSNTNYCAISSCDFGGLDTSIEHAVRTQATKLWFYDCIGSNMKYPIVMKAFSQVYLPRSGTSKVPDYTGSSIVANGDSGERVHSFEGGTYTKTPSSGWNPVYTPTQKTQVWDFTKIWSDETLNGWGDRQELIQGYSSAWATGRWTGYMQMTDDMLDIRNAISGGTNLSGRLYVQRKTSSGNATDSKLCLYASDGTTITTTTTIDRGQGVWVPLSRDIVEKIKNGSIKYFYLRADKDNKETFFKCETNAKIEITYTN